jgi:[ribosomal protein S5]-alanine N-acetyltransferase
LRNRIELRPVAPEVARALLDDRRPEGIAFADGYPSEFSLEVMDLVAGERAGQAAGFGPYFIVRAENDTVIGEVGGAHDREKRTVQVGYSIVEPQWGKGYATEALELVLAAAFADPGVDRVIGDTMVDHGASRRVMEKAGMRAVGERDAEEDGKPVRLVTYEARRV